MILDEIIRAVVKRVFVEMGKPCEPSIERTQLAEAEGGKGGDYDRAGEWRIQCGKDVPFMLSLSNAETKDPATRGKLIEAAIRRAVNL